MGYVSPSPSTPLCLAGVEWFRIPDGFRTIYRSEGIRGLYRGTLLALVGVSNGAVQFMMYEEMKRWGFERKRRRMEREGKAYTASDDHLVRIRAQPSYVHSF